MRGGSPERLRIDRWLWCARFFKTRSAAAQAVRAGHVRLRGERVKPAHEVAPGARLSIVRGDQTVEITVVGVPSRRGPAGQAAQLYEEDAASVERRLEALTRKRAERSMRPPTPGRPDKRTRRLIRERLRGPLSPR